MRTLSHLSLFFLLRFDREELDPARASAVTGEGIGAAGGPAAWVQEPAAGEAAAETERMASMRANTRFARPWS